MTSKQQTKGQRRAQRQATWWAEQMAAATTPAARALLLFNWLQARVKPLPQAEQDAVWHQLTATLHAVGDRYLHAKFANEICTDRGPTRPDLYGHTP